MESLKNIDDIILLFYPSNDAEHANHGGELYLKEIVIEVWGDLDYNFFQIQFKIGRAHV